MEAPRESVTVPSVPRQPSERAKKLVFRYRGKQRNAFYVGGLFIAGVIIALVGLPDVADDLALDFLAHSEVAGQINHIEKSMSKGRHVSSCATFVDRAALGLSGTTCNLPTSTALGPTTLEVRGDAARVKGGRIALPLPLVVVFIGVFSMYGLIALAFVVGNRREVRAFRYGRSTVGRVDKIVAHKGDWSVRYSFVVDDKTYNGTLDANSREDVAFADEGGAIFVLYLPENPKVSTIYVD